MGHDTKDDLKIFSKRNYFANSYHASVTFHEIFSVNCLPTCRLIIAFFAMARVKAGPCFDQALVCIISHYFQ